MDLAPSQVPLRSTEKRYKRNLGLVVWWFGGLLFPIKNPASGRDDPL